MGYRGPLDWLIRRPIAHRGLHDGNVAVMENSLSAARAAIGGAFAIECDVLLTRDRVPVIFHDATLDRLTGATSRLADLSLEEASNLTLGATSDRIPAVQEFLALIEGKVPVVMELKGTSIDVDRDFLDRLMPLISSYDGPLALMSFDPWLIDQALAAGRFPVGLTAEGDAAELTDRHREVFERGCDFVSYNVRHLPHPFVEWVRTERKAPVITWTVRTSDDVGATREHADQMTFEGFVPQA